MCQGTCSNPDFLPHNASAHNFSYKFLSYNIASTLKLWTGWATLAASTRRLFRWMSLFSKSKYTHIKQKRYPSFCHTLETKRRSALYPVGFVNDSLVLLRVAQHAKAPWQHMTAEAQRRLHQCAEVLVHGVKRNPFSSFFLCFSLLFQMILFRLEIVVLKTVYLFCINGESVDVIPRALWQPWQ